MIYSTKATAPGKLILLGEYAVLFGTPAIVLAVERRARVELRPAAGPLWRVTAPGLLPGESMFQVGAGGVIRWDDPRDVERLGLLELLLRGLSEMAILEPSDLPPLSILLDTREFFQEDMPGRPKLGLGSSAALVSATATALTAWSRNGVAPQADPAWLEQLVQLHRRIQGGMGSGADVAASLFGGTIQYRLRGDPPRPEALPLDPPAGVSLRFVWTGHPAKTGDFLGRLRKALDDHPAATRSCLDVLDSLSRLGADHIKRRDPTAILGTVEAFWRALDRLGRCIDVPILSPGHLELHELALECGVAYKPSGAGGGDFGIAFGQRPGDLDRFVRLAAGAGYRPIPLEVARRGVTVRSKR